MTHQDDQDQQVKSRRLLSIAGLQVFLLAFLPVVALSFVVVGVLKQQAAQIDPGRAQSRLYKPVILLPGQFVTKKIKLKSESEEFSANAGSMEAQPETQPVQTQPEKPAQTEEVITAKAETAPKPEPEVKKPVAMAATTTMVPAQATTAPNMIDAAVTTTSIPPAPAEEETAAKKFNLPAPRWQELDDKWESVKPGSSPEGEADTKSAGAWKQIGLGQSEKTGFGSAETPTIAKLRKQSTIELKQTSRPEVKKSTPTKTAKRSGRVTRKRTSPAMAIINVTGDPRLGRTYRDVLKAMGFPVALVTDKPRKVGQTTIFYKKAARQMASRLKSQIPGEEKMAAITWKSKYDVVLMVY